VLDGEMLAASAWTLAGGTLTIPGVETGDMTIGFTFPFELEPTDLIELGDHGTQKRISKLSMYLLQSGGCDVYINGQQSPFQAAAQLAAGNRLNGEYEISVGGGTESAVKIKLTGEHHLPFAISAFGVHGQTSR